MAKLMTMLLAGAMLSLAALPALSARDEVQIQMMQRLHESKQKLAAAEAAKGQERARLMDEHMKMMKDLMTQMQAAKLKPGMTAQEANEWIAEHMKLMDGMMDQMMKEHHMMMMQH